MSITMKSGLAAAMLAGAIAATPALAEAGYGEKAEMTVAAVRYDDLDLSTERGERQLHNRLRRAAHYACGMDIIPAGSRLPSTEARVCYAENLSSFEHRIAAIVEAKRRDA